MKLTTLAMVALLAFVGCKESPESAAKRIRETMAAMQEQRQADADKMVATARAGGTMRSL